LKISDEEGAPTDLLRLLNCSSRGQAEIQEMMRHSIQGGKKKKKRGKRHSVKTHQQEDAMGGKGKETFCQHVTMPVSSSLSAAQNILKSE
jgi:hypothetical protein